MKRAVFGSVLALLGLAACTRHEGKPEAPRPPTPAQNAPVEAPNAASDASAAEPPLALTLKPEHTPEGIGLRVLNPGRKRVRLAREVTLEALDAQGKPQAERGQSLELKLDCTAQGCVTLGPGSELVAPPWLDLIGAERCGELLRPPAPGQYRMRVRRCSGEGSAEVTFAWPRP